MDDSKITGHMLICNEEQWMWYAIKSVIEYLDELLVFDTGSKDKTRSILKLLVKEYPKIKVNLFSTQKPSQLVELRNEQIKLTKTSWFLLLDGDEVWPKSTIEELVKFIKNAPRKTIAVSLKAKIAVGDLFHYQPENAGRYEILGFQGHFNIRAYRKNQNYKWQGKYPLEAYVNDDGLPVQNTPQALTLLRNEYWHLTHLPRSTFDTHHKYKYEIGKKYLGKLPEVFFQTRPRIVPTPWLSFGPKEYLLANILSPLLNHKRKIK